MGHSLRVAPTAAASGVMGVILAIDYGQKRLGLALSDENGLTSRPLAIWTRTNRRRDLARLRELARKHDVRRIVVGLPLHLDGTPSEMSEEARRFARRVEKALGIRVEIMDERLSSWEAQRTVSITKSRSRLAAPRNSANTRKTPVDDVAAAVILRDYLGRARQRTGLQD